MQNIQQTSKRFRIIFTIGFWLIPIFSLFFWLSGGFPDIPTVDVFMPSEYVPLVQAMPLWARLVGFFISLAPISIVMFIMYLLIKLFKLYEHNKIFTETNVRLIRNIGYSILVGEVIGLCYHPIITTLVSATSHIILPTAEIRFDIGDITTFLVAFVIILVAWIMRAGQKLQEESDYTI